MKKISHCSLGRLENSCIKYATFGIVASVVLNAKNPVFLPLSSLSMIVHVSVAKKIGPFLSFVGKNVAETVWGLLWPWRPWTPRGLVPYRLLAQNTSTMIPRASKDDQRGEHQS